MGIHHLLYLRGNGDLQKKIDHDDWYAGEYDDERTVVDMMLDKSALNAGCSCYARTVCNANMPDWEAAYSDPIDATYSDPIYVYMGGRIQ